MNTRATSAIARNRRFLWSIGVISSLWSAELQAVTPAEMAAQLFREGRALMDRKQYSEACAKFAQSYKARPAGGTILNLAACHKAEGNSLAAWADLHKALRFARLIDRKDREHAAQRLLAELSATLPKILLQVAEATAKLPDLKVTIDNVPIAPEQWSAGVPVDPGNHTIVASASGRISSWTMVQVGRVPTTVPATIPALPPIQLEARPAPTHFDPIAMDPAALPIAIVISRGSPGHRDDQTSSVSAPPTANLPWSTATGVGAALGGVGLLGLGTAMGFRMHAVEAHSQSEPYCTGDFCTSEGRQLRSDAVTSNDMAIATVIVGGAASAAGVALWIFGSRSSTKGAPPSKSASLRIGGQGVWLAGRF